MIRLFMKAEKGGLFDKATLKCINDDQGNKLESLAKNNIGKIFVVEIKELELKGDGQ